MCWHTAIRFLVFLFHNQKLEALHMSGMPHESLDTRPLLQIPELDSTVVARREQEVFGVALAWLCRDRKRCVLYTLFRGRAFAIPQKNGIDPALMTP